MRIDKLAIDPSRNFMDDDMGPVQEYGQDIEK